MTWTQVYDEASGAHYYYDDETGLTQWEQPDAFESAARPDSIVVDAQTADALRSVQPRGAWTECFDETTGHWFFYNTITGETCWEKPSGFVAGGLVAVIAAKAGYQATAHEPLCAACFDRSTPLRRSKLFWLLALLALAGLLAAFVLSLSPCEEKVALEYREHTTNVTTLAVTRNYTKVYSAGPCANAVSPAAVEIIADGAANQTTVLFNYTLDHKCLLNATSKLDFVLAQDLSGSFSDDLPNVRAMWPTILADLSASYDTAFGVTSYKDMPCSPLGSGSDYPYRIHIGLTNDTAGTQGEVDAFAASGGGDGPESQLYALYHIAADANKADGYYTATAGDLGWREDSNHALTRS